MKKVTKNPDPIHGTSDLSPLRTWVLLAAWIGGSVVVVDLVVRGLCYLLL